MRFSVVHFYLLHFVLQANWNLVAIRRQELAYYTTFYSRCFYNLLKLNDLTKPYIYIGHI